MGFFNTFLHFFLFLLVFLFLLFFFLSLFPFFLFLLLFLLPLLFLPSLFFILHLLLIHFHLHLINLFFSCFQILVNFLELFLKTRIKVKQTTKQQNATNLLLLQLFLQVFHIRLKSNNFFIQ